jgi:hypothetical protein
MLWKIQPEHGKFQIHKENADGSLGEPVGRPHDTRTEALAHLKALHANTSDANMQISYDTASSANAAVITTPNAMLGKVHFEADAQNPRLLHFKDFILARPETNKNRDSVDAQGIRELAAR